ncbi:MAG: hypothetical protein HONBIEJF_02825 [Fimbriimonadaceae bacterium]|nr:hypothetical protein [Fimbriimonadaceae bacterium]
MADERVFSEQEVTQILRRAVALTEAGADKAYAPGVTIEELERIAAEVGVSPRALAQAILEQGAEPTKKGVLNLTEEFERVVAGEMDPAQYDVILDGLKPLANAGQPHASQIGRKLTASVWTGVGQAKIDVTSRNGRTKLSVKSNALFQGLMTLYPSLIGSIIAIASTADKGMAAVGLAIAACLMTVGSFAFTALTRIGHRRAEKIADDLRTRIASTIDSGSMATTTQTPENEHTIQQRLGGE